MTEPSDIDVSDMRVLLVEDMQAMRLIQRGVLEDMGIRNIEEAVDGGDGLKRVRDGNFDLVICDWDMPGTGGLEVLETIRREQKTSDLPFLMVTAFTETEKVKAVIQAGANDYLAKPFEHDQLEYKAYKLLARRKTKQQEAK